MFREEACDAEVDDFHFTCFGENHVDDAHDVWMRQALLVSFAIQRLDAARRAFRTGDLESDLGGLDRSVRLSAGLALAASRRVPAIMIDIHMIRK
jgi:hypothetical protein